MKTAGLKKTFAVVKEGEKEPKHIVALNKSLPAVISDPISGLLQLDRTLRFLDGTELEVKRTCNIAVGNLSISARDRVKLKKQFDLLAENLEETRERCIQNEENGHKILRDCFANSNKICLEIADIAAAGQRYSPFSTATSKRRTALAGIEKYFSDLGHLSWQLKRHHYTYSASFAFDDHARATVDALALAAPGFIRGRTGSEFVSSTDVGFGVKTALLHKGADIGPAANFRYQKRDRKFIDEDCDWVATETTESTARVGMFFKFGKLFKGKGHDEKTSHIVNVSASARASITTGSYYDHFDPLSSTKASLQRISDGRFWSLVCRSGDANAVSNRAFAKAGRVRNGVAKWVFGALYTPLVGLPNVNQKKINKGAWNGAKIMELAGRLGDTLPPPYRGPQENSIAALVKGAYAPITAIDIAEADECNATCTGQVTPTIYNPLQKISPLPSPFNKETGKSNKSIFRRTGAVEATAGITSLDYAHPQLGQARATAVAAAAAEYSANRIGFRRAKASHEALDPAYNKDIETSYRILRKLETRYHGTAKLHTYQRIASMLNEKVSDWKHDPHVQAALQMDNAERALKQIKDTYARFADIASMRKALMDPRYRKSIPDRGAQADAEFDGFARNLFGIDKFANREQREFLTAIRNDPEKFMCEGYDALSISLGKIGIHLFDAKKQVNECCHGNSLGKNHLWNDMQQLDVQFSSVRRMFNGVFMPISEETLYRAASVTTTSDSVNTTMTGTLDASAGMWTSPAQYFPGNSHDPTSPVHGHAPLHRGWVSMANGIGVGGNASFTRRSAEFHPNPLRCGVYSLKRFGLRGSGLAALLVGGGIDRWYKKFLPKCSAQGAAVPDGEIKKLSMHTLLIAQRMGLGEYSKELGVDYSTRTPKPVGRFEYEASSQYVRISAKESIGETFTAAGMTGISPVVVSGSVGASQSVTDIVLETMGPCPAYHMLQFSRMKTLLNECQTDAAKKRDANSGHVKGVNFETLSDLNYTKMRNMLAPEKLQDYVAGSAVDRSYMVNKYFGSEETILGFMDKFLRYSETRRPVDSDRPVNFAGPRTEFHRFDDDESYFNIIKNVRDSEKYAPGSLINSKTEYAQTRENFEKATSRDARPEIDIQAVKAAMTAMRNAFDGRTDVTAEERARYLLGGTDSPHGKTIFDAYIKVVSGYTEVHNAVKPTCTYRMHLAGE